MRIIDKRKDFYDYIAGIEGIDSDLVFDRRDYVILNQFPREQKVDWLESILSLNRSIFDRGKEIGNAYKLGNHSLLNKDYKEPCGIVNYITLEIGYHHYSFRVERYMDSGRLIIDCEIIKDVIVTEKLMDTAVGIKEIYYIDRFSNDINISYSPRSKEAKNLILKDTILVGYLNPEQVYHDIYDYLFKLKEPKVVDNRSDKLKILNNGFDPVTSFRNIK